MKKTFEMTDLECAHCAAKMEDAIRKLEGISHVSVNFLAQKMTIEGDDSRFDELVKQAVQICKKVEPDCGVVIK